MITIYYKKKHFSLPGSFEELSGKQFIAIAELLYTGGNQLHCHLKALRILTGLSRVRFRLLNSEIVEKCLSFVEWVFGDQPKSTKQMVPVYNDYHGPISDFDNLKMNEFHFSEQHYSDLVYQGNEKVIDELVAVLYRPAKPGYDSEKNSDGDIRFAFNANEIAYNANKIARWPAAVKHAIFLWYATCRQKLVDDNELVFKEPVKGFESQFDTGLYGMMRSLAGEKLGTVADIEEMYVHTAMLELGLLKEEEQRLEMEKPTV